MRDFAQHRDVVQLFKETSLKRSIIVEMSGMKLANHLDV